MPLPPSRRRREGTPPRTSAPGGGLSLRLLLLLGAFSAFGSLSIDCYLPAFPQITAEFGSGSLSVEMTLATFLLGMGAGQALFGPISDRFGRRGPMIVGCGVFAFGALICMTAHTMGWLAAARLIQGLGAAAGSVIARATVRDLFEEREAAHAFSQLVLVMGVAPILGPWVGGQILLFAGWRDIFLLSVFFGLLCLFFTARSLPETLPVERRAPGGVAHALRNFGTLSRDPVFLGYVMAIGLCTATMFAYIAGSPLVLMQIHGVSPQHYGFLFAANAAGYIAAAQCNRPLLRRYSPETIFVTALWANTLAACGLLVCGLTGWGGLTALAVLLFACLGSIGLAAPNLTAAALARYGAFAGSASSLLGSAQFMVGGAAGAAVGMLRNDTAVPMTATMAACAVGSLVLVHLLAPRRSPVSPVHTSAV